MIFPGKSECQLWRGNYIYGGEELTVKIQFRGGSGPQILGQKLGKGLRIPRIDLEIKRKSTIFNGNPDDSLKTLRRKSLIAVLGGKLYGRGKYQPEIQFPEGEGVYGRRKSYRYIRYLSRK